MPDPELDHGIMPNPARTLDLALRRGNNNFDLLRLVAALMVIFGHAHALSPRPTSGDLVQHLLHFDYSGSLAVKIFFFLSGLLVANSLLEKPDLLQFLANRAFRIFPGLLVCLLVCAFVIGAAFTTLPLSEYLRHPDVRGFVVHNLALLNLRWRLPGVFEASRFGVNGSLWTLPFEVLCYLYLAVAGGLGILRSRWLGSALLGGVVAVAFLAPERLPHFGANGEAQLLPACFAMGAVCAVHKARLPLRWQPALALWLLVVLSPDPGAYRFTFYVALFYSVLVVATHRLVVERLALPFDASYGVYVYAFPVQQALYAAFPGLGVHRNQALTAAIVLGLGTASWYAVEKPAMTQGRRLVKWLAALLSGDPAASAGPRAALAARVRSATAALARWELGALVAALAAIHAIALRLVFPGYYSPLRPSHSDFYIPVALRYSGWSAVDLLRAPRPVGMAFAVAVGHLGIEGAIVAVIAVVFLGCALTAMVLRRAAGIPFGGPFLAGFAALAFVLFTQPAFYVFYTHDGFAQLSWLLLAAGAWVLQRHLEAAPRRALAAFALLALAAFLTKETFALTALLLAAAWGWARRRDGLLRAGGPALATAAALAAALAWNRLARSVFLAAPPAADDPYRLDPSAASLLREWARYAGEALNPLTLALLVLAAGAVVLLARDRRGRALALLCPAAAALAWVPNALLPNHHFAGYSCSAAPLLFAPLLLAAPLLAGASGRARLLAPALAALALVSPAASAARYRANDWAVGQERIQRNVLRSLRRAVAPAPAATEDVLVTGVDFPFSPFDHSRALAAFPNAARRRFDVVRYAGVPAPAAWAVGVPLPTSSDRVRSIRPADVDLARYARVWAFRSDGTLALDAAQPGRLATGRDGEGVLRAADLVLFPDLLDLFAVRPGVDVALADQDAGRLVRCGAKLVGVGQAALAERCLVPAARREPENAYAQFYLALAHEQLGREALARQEIERAVALDDRAAPNPWFRAALARLRREPAGATTRGP